MRKPIWKEVPKAEKVGFHLKMQMSHMTHPFNAPWEYAVNIDFVNEDRGVGARVAVELSPESAKLLADSIMKALERGEADPQIQISVL